MPTELELEINLIAAFHLLDERFTHDYFRLLRQRHLATADSFEASNRRIDLLAKEINRNRITPLELKIRLTPKDILETLYTREYLYSVANTFPDCELSSFIFLSGSPITQDVRNAVIKAEPDGYEYS